MHARIRARVMASVYKENAFAKVDLRALLVLLKRQRMGHWQIWPTMRFLLVDWISN
jgi:hypothetical protein